MVEVFKELEQPHNVTTCYFHYIVVLLHMGKGSEANEKLNQFMK